MALNKEFYAFITKREGDIIVKGMSFDKSTWYLIPNNKRSIDYHPLILKYFNYKKCVNQSKVHRTPTVRLTKEIRQTYLDDNDKFVFDGQRLEVDNNLKNDSIVNEIKSSALDKQEDTKCKLLNLI